MKNQTLISEMWKQFSSSGISSFPGRLSANDSSNQEIGDFEGRRKAAKQEAQKLI